MCSHTGSSLIVLVHQLQTHSPPHTHPHAHITTLLFALPCVPASLFIPLPSSILSMCLSINTSCSHRSAALARCVFVCVCVSGVRVLSARGACTSEPRFIGPCGAGSTHNNQALHKLSGSANSVSVRNASTWARTRSSAVRGKSCPLPSARLSATRSSSNRASMGRPMQHRSPRSS